MDDGVGVPVGIGVGVGVGEGDEARVGMMVGVGKVVSGGARGGVSVVADCVASPSLPAQARRRNAVRHVRVIRAMAGVRSVTGPDHLSFQV